MVSDPKRRAVTATIVACAAVALAGCGIKGPLKLPEGTPAASVAPANTPPRTDDESGMKPR